MPNVLILPRSADYSEEVWMEIREKAITMLHSFFHDAIIPKDAISDDEGNQSEVMEGEDDSEVLPKTEEIPPPPPQFNHHQNQPVQSLIDSTLLSRESNISENSRPRGEGRRGRSGKKSKKRSACRRSQPKSDEYVAAGDSHSASHHDHDAAVVSSSSQLGSPEESRNKHICLADQASGSTPAMKSTDDLREGYVIVMGPKSQQGYYTSRRRLADGDFFLEIMTNVSRRDPSAQFLVTFPGKVVEPFVSICSYFLDHS